MELASQLSSLQNLEHLMLDGNPLQEDGRYIEKVLLQNLRSLRSLDISTKHIHSPRSNQDNQYVSSPSQATTAGLAGYSTSL